MFGLLLLSVPVISPGVFTVRQRHVEHYLSSNKIFQTVARSIQMGINDVIVAYTVKRNAVSIIAVSRTSLISDSTVDSK